jgi:hypothetical protein
MRRLESLRKVRCVPRARNYVEPVLFLAQIVRERRRLEQERGTLLKRIGKINLRLDEIGTTETKIMPTIKAAPEPNALHVSEANVPQRVAVRSSGMERSRILPTGFAEFVLQY